MYQYPYGNAQQLNLDWILSMLKKTLEDVAISADFQVVENYNELLASTKKWVLVLHNDGAFGDGGYCLFKDMGIQTNRTIKRNNNTYVGAVPDQCNLYPSSAKYADIMGTLSGYIGNGSLVYGGNHTLFDDTCTDQIDCSSFVNAIIYGIKYNTSRYVLGSSAENVIPDNNVNNLFPDGLYRKNALNTREMAAYYAQHKMLFTLPEDVNAAVRMLQFGDILFMGSSGADNYNESYLNIGHVALVLGTDTVNNRIVIAQGGGSPAPTGNVQNTVCKISIYYLDGSQSIEPEKALFNIKAFARPVYSIPDTSGADVRKSIVTDGEYLYKTQMIPCLIISGSTHKLSTSTRAAGDPVYIEVEEGDTLEKVGTYGSAAFSFFKEDGAYVSTVFNNTATVPTNAKYCFFYVYTSNSFPTIDDCINTTFKITNHKLITNVDDIENSISDIEDNIGDIEDDIDGIEGQLSTIEPALAIVSDNNVHIAITTGQKVYVKNNPTLTEGLYIAIADIAANETLTSSNVALCVNGGFNEVIPISQGGTGATTPEQAKNNFRIDGLKLFKPSISPNSSLTLHIPFAARGYIQIFGNTSAAFSIEMYSTHPSTGLQHQNIMTSSYITYTYNDYDVTIQNTSNFTLQIIVLEFSNGNISWN